MHARVYSNLEFGSMLAAEDDGKIYIDGVKLADLLGYEYPELAVKTHTSGTHTPLGLIYKDDGLYLIAGKRLRDFDRTQRLLEWLEEIDMSLTSISQGR